LEISTSHPNDSLSVSTESTNGDYQLNITLIDTHGRQHTFTGAGTIPVYDGAVYAVDINEDSAGNFTAILRPEQGGT
jgi:hypothetical protein